MLDKLNPLREVF